jgi:plasmid stabilization system protein ParE
VARSTGSLLEVYDSLIASGALRADAEQRRIARKLSKLAEILRTYTPPPPPAPPSRESAKDGKQDKDVPDEGRREQASPVRASVSRHIGAKAHLNGDTP